MSASTTCPPPVDWCFFFLVGPDPDGITRPHPCYASDSRVTRELLWGPSRVTDTDVLWAFSSVRIRR